MAGEDNTTVTDTGEYFPDRKSIATLDVGAETVPFKGDDVAETVSLKDDEGLVKSDDVAEKEDSVPDLEEQAANVEAETASLKNDGVLVEGDDVAADDSSVKVAEAIKTYGRKINKHGRKSDTEIARMKIEEEALGKTLENGENKETGEGDDVANGGDSSVKVNATKGKKRGRKSKTEKEAQAAEGAKVAVGGGSSSVGVRKSERPRKIRVIESDVCMSMVEEEVEKKEKKKRGRKKLNNVTSDENEVAKEGEIERIVKKEKKKPGRKKKKVSGSEENEAGEEGENGSFVKEEKNKSGGRKRKIAENELVCENKSESDLLKEENQDCAEAEMPLSDIKGYCLRNAAKKNIESSEKKVQKVRKVSKFNERIKWIEEESLMCHQCQRNDKGRVVRCKKCKRKRYCVFCINNWYPYLEEDHIAEACPVCCGNCNCKACLRSTALINEIKKNAKTNSDHEVEHFEYMLKELLPYLRRLDEEQLAEKEIEAKRQGISLSEVKIRLADYPKKERVYCDNCKTSIFDFHRSCTKCAFDLCLFCCCELRGGQLLGGADPIEFQFINQGQDYLHGEIAKRTARNSEYHAAVQPEICEWSKSGWHADCDGNIPCPKANNECGHGFLELRSILPPNCISELVCKARELAETIKLQDAEATLDNGCSCLKPVRNADDTPNNTRKAAFRDHSSDNFLYCPRAVDLHHEDLRHFQWHWSKGEPVIVSNVLECTSGLSWEPLVMWRAFRQISNTKHNVLLDVKAIDCLDWCEGDINVHQFFTGYTNGRMDWLKWPQVNVLTHIAQVELKPEAIAAIKKLTRKHLEQDKRELHCDNLDGDTVDLFDNLSSSKNASDEQNSVRVLQNESGMCDGKVVDPVHQHPDTDDDVLHSGSELKEVNKVNVKQENCSLVGGDSSDGALWDIFRREDVPKLQEYLKKHFREFRHVHCSPLKQVIHPIHDQTFYLTIEHKKRLKEEYGIEPWTFVQKLGDAVFIPAGCPHQVRNLKSCTKVALDFVSPENVGECFRLTEEFRKLPVNHRSTEDKLEVKKMIVYAMLDVVKNLEKARSKETNAPM
ncbi:lysine-specific demethylase JMJ26-like isoform X3 [Cicer arietinum]|uniref:Lysine-specific demethylase JMJ25-like isoform X2 n=1 Tax=Cicer arietinum TaxID=3827 RepID=A0A3Q7YAM7_CICAR|nr:lysine-specific demethylase JMJ25-like isoform X2 [Cicer arietinum]